MSKSKPPKKSDVATQEISQTIVQGNSVDVTGEVDASIVVKGSLDGKIRDIEVGLITGDVVQSDSAVQAASNSSGKGKPRAEQAIDQAILQGNQVSAAGEVDLTIVVEGNLKGDIRDIEVGLITGDVVQSNSAAQLASNSTSGKGRSRAEQEIDQAIVQGNLLEVYGDVDVTIVVEGDFHGKIRDIEIGLITADVTQSNAGLQVASNDAGGKGKTGRERRAGRRSTSSPSRRTRSARTANSTSSSRSAGTTRATSATWRSAWSPASSTSPTSPRRSPPTRPATTRSSAEPPGTGRRGPGLAETRCQGSTPRARSRPGLPSAV
jgi:hypothetical protein